MNKIFYRLHKSDLENFKALMEGRPVTYQHQENKKDHLLGSMLHTNIPVLYDAIYICGNRSIKIEFSSIPFTV